MWWSTTYSKYSTQRREILTIRQVFCQWPDTPIGRVPDNQGDPGSNP